MKILIYTTHRTGSTSLANFLMAHFNCPYQREGIFQNENFIKKIKTIDNIIIKLTPNEVEYNSIRNIFDKCIVLTRTNTLEQAESRTYADEVKKYHKAYKIEEGFFETHKIQFNRMIEVIKSENDILSRCMDCLHITYEELYYSESGISKLEDYLNIKFKFKLDNTKKYRNMNKTLI